MSREPELYKDKIEVSLDGRQIFYLFFGGAVIVGLVFVLGVMVGRRVEARGHLDRAQTASAVDPLAALDRLEGGNGLSFQGALRGGNAPVPEVDRTIDELAKARQAKPATVDKKADAKKSDDKKAEAEHKVEKAPADDKKAEAEHKADKADKTDDKKADDKKAEAEHKSDKADKADDKKAEADHKPDKTRFTLQLSSFQDKTEAQAFLDQVKTAGYQAYVTEGAVDGKQYFRVRLGSYRSLEAANDAKSDFEKTAKKSAFVTKL